MYIEIVSLNTKLSYCCVPVIFPCSILKSLVFWNILFFCVTNPDVPDFVIVWHEQGFRFRCSLSIVNYVNGRLRLSIAILVKKYWRWENIFMSSFLWTSPPASESFTPLLLCSMCLTYRKVFSPIFSSIFSRVAPVSLLLLLVQTLGHLLTSCKAVFLSSLVLILLIDAAINTSIGSCLGVVFFNPLKYEYT